MEKERSHQWYLAFFGLFAVVIGGLIGVGGSWWIWHLQQNADDEQKLIEQHNIAQALYFDISNVEDCLNFSLSHSSFSANNTGSGDPAYIHATTLQYYRNYGLYYIFSKDISGFDSETSEDLYDFYSSVMDIESQREDAAAIVEKELRLENITQYDIIKAHVAAANLYAAMPYCIETAEKVKQELRQKYNVRITVPPSIVTIHSPEIYNLQGGQMQVTAY